MRADSTATSAVRSPLSLRDWILPAQGFAVTLDDMLQVRSQWPLVADLITSDQLPAQRLAEISARYPEFAAWLVRDRVRALN